MYVVLSSLISWFGLIISTILDFVIPNGNGGYIKLRSLFLFLFLTKLGFMVVKMFLTKDHLDNLEYERQERRERIRNERKANQ